MRTYDFSPLWRSTIGFDRLFDLAEAAQRASEDHYPPYNIERLGDDRYQISLAVAGFSPDEISVTAEQNVVTIEGNKTEKTEREYLYRGISTRRFKRQFNLADYVHSSAVELGPVGGAGKRGEHVCELHGPRQPDHAVAGVGADGLHPGDVAEPGGHFTDAAAAAHAADEQVAAHACRVHSRESFGSDVAQSAVPCCPHAVHAAATLPVAPPRPPGHRPSVAAVLPLSHCRPGSGSLAVPR